MPSWYCPDCFADVDERAVRCPVCGADLATDRPYEQKLGSALRHRLADRRLLAAWILGERGERWAVPMLEDAAEHDPDPFVRAAARRAMARVLRGGAETDAPGSGRQRSWP